MSLFVLVVDLGPLQLITKFFLLSVDLFLVSILQVYSLLKILLAS